MNGFESVGDEYGELVGDDIVGEDLDIVGSDFELVGARASAAFGRVKRLVRSGSKIWMRKVLPIGRLTIAAGGNGTAALQPQETFRPERLCIVAPDAQFSALDITQIKCQTKDMLIGTGAIPAAMFSPNAFDTRVQFATVRPGSILQMAFLNTDAAPISFNGGFFGVSIDL